MSSQLERDLAQLLEDSKNSMTKVAEDTTEAPVKSSIPETDVGVQLRKLASAVRNFKGNINYNDLAQVLNAGAKK
jgi:hypothetical protein